MPSLQFIQFIFAYLFINKSNNYDKFDTNSFITSLKKSKNAEFVDQIEKYLNNEKLSVQTLAKFIHHVFTQFDPNKIGFYAFQLIYDIKNNKNIQFVKHCNDLIEFCNNFILPVDFTNSVHVNDTQNDIISSTISYSLTNSNNLNNIFNLPTSTAKDSNSSNINQTELKNTITEILKTSLNDMINQNNSHQNQTIDSRINCLITNEIKLSHYDDLNKLIKKERQRLNNETITKGYIDNQIYPKILSDFSFPPPLFKHDKSYITDYNKLLNNFRNQIPNLNLDFIRKDLNDIQSKIKTKLDVIKSFDNEASNKYDTMFKDMENKFKEEFKTAYEKINNIIAKNKNKSNVINKNKHENNKNTKTKTIFNHKVNQYKQPRTNVPINVSNNNQSHNIRKFIPTNTAYRNDNTINQFSKSKLYTNNQPSIKYNYTPRRSFFQSSNTSHNQYQNHNSYYKQNASSNNLQQFDYYYKNNSNVLNNNRQVKKSVNMI